MGIKVVTACQPQGGEGRARVSFNFSTVQLSKEKNMKWNVISKMEEENSISFTVMQEGSDGEHKVIYEDVHHGVVMPYESLRNLYIASPQNVKGHFIVEIESVE